MAEQQHPRLVRRCCGRQYISTPSVLCSFVIHCLGTSCLLQHYFFPSLTTSRSHQTQKVKSLKPTTKKLKEIMKKIPLKLMKCHKVFQSTRKQFQSCETVHIHCKKKMFKNQYFLDKQSKVQVAICEISNTHMTSNLIIIQAK